MSKSGLIRLEKVDHELGSNESEPSLIQCSICKFKMISRLCSSISDPIGMSVVPDLAFSAKKGDVFTEKSKKIESSPEITRIFLHLYVKPGHWVGGWYERRKLMWRWCTGVFRVSRGVLIGVFRPGRDRGEVEVKHWELLLLMLLLASKSLLFSLGWTKFGQFGQAMPKIVSNT